MLAEITPLNFRFISMGLVVHGLSCFSVPVQKSLWHPLQTRLSLYPAAIFFLTLPLQFLQDPGLIILLPHRQSSVFLSPHSLLSHPVLHFPAIWMGTLLSLSETHYFECLLLMSASPHHLGKEGKIHKRDEKCISFSFYFKKFEGRVLVLLNFS